MLRNTRVQMAAILAAGALLGYLAAAGRLNPFGGRRPDRRRRRPAGLKPADADAGRSRPFVKTSTSPS